MRTIDQLYDAVRYGLFETFSEKRNDFITKAISGGLKNHKLAAKIIYLWSVIFSDDYYPTDYWAEKWVLLKCIAVGKRKRDNLEHIVDSCIYLIKNGCKRTTFSNEPYENNLMRWV